MVLLEPLRRLVVRAVTLGGLGALHEDLRSDGRNLADLERNFDELGTAQDEPPAVRDADEELVAKLVFHDAPGTLGNGNDHTKGIGRNHGLPPIFRHLKFFESVMSDADAGI